MMFSTMRSSVFPKLLFFALILFAIPPLQAQKIVSNLHNFGKISMEAPMEHTFEFENDGSEILEIQNLQMKPPLIVKKMTSRIEPGKTVRETFTLESPRQPW